MTTRTRHPVKAEELSGAEMLGCLPSEALRDLASSARRRRFKPGEMVFKEGDTGNSLHVVRHGLLKVVRPTVDQRLVLDHVEPGQAFGELAVLNSAPRLASVIAVEHCETIELFKTDFERVLDAHPGAARKMLGLLARSLTLAKEELARSNSRLEDTVRARTAELRESQLEVVRRLSQAAESRDQATGVHIVRMSRLCERLAQECGSSPSECELILHASPMHDVGKIAIPDRILLKPGSLDPDEWEVMKSHAEIGAQLLAGSRSPIVRMGELIALTHHERWDGSGYPRGLRGEEIPFVARVTSVCDVFDALISERPYKGAWTLDDAFDEIRRQSDSQFEPAVAEAFVSIRADVVRIVESANRELLAD